MYLCHCHLYILFEYKINSGSEDLFGEDSDDNREESEWSIDQQMMSELNTSMAKSEKELQSVIAKVIIYVLKALLFL